MDGSQTPSQTGSRRFRSPRHAMIRWLEQSRDNWKHKYLQLKQKLKRAENRARAATRRRAMWKRKAIDLHADKKRLSDELEQTKKRLQALERGSSEGADTSQKARRRAAR